jgi:hypothetical protein
MPEDAASLRARVNCDAARLGRHYRPFNAIGRSAPERTTALSAFCLGTESEVGNEISQMKAEPRSVVTFIGLKKTQLSGSVQCAAGVHL